MSNTIRSEALTMATERARDALRRAALAQSSDSRTTKWIMPKGLTLYAIKRASK